MKKYLLLPLFTVSFLLLNAQVFFENFDVTPLQTPWQQGVNNVDDVFNWTINSGSTSSNNTGPSDDMTVGGNYIYIEATSRNFQDSAIIFTPYIDLSNITLPVLYFNTHMYGSAIGTYRIDISNDSGVTYDNIFSKSGDQGDQWNQEFIDLSSFSGNIKFKIVGITGIDANGDVWPGDIAFDNFEIKESNLVNMEMTSLDIPIFDAAGSTNIRGVVTNYGYDTISSFDIVWDDGSGSQSETFNVNLAINESYTFSHVTPISTTSGKTYDINVKVVASGDGDSTNNLLSHSLNTWSYLPFKKVLFEDQTIGANNFGGWSPRGIVRLEEFILSSSSDSAEIISVHGNMGGNTDDAMYYQEYQEASFGNGNPFVSANGWPQNIYDRKESKNYDTTIGSVISNFNEFKNGFGVADIEVNPSYDTTNRNLTVSAKIKFAVNAANLNLALVITEDSVHDDNDMGYSQSNWAYFGGNNGPLSSTSIDFTSAGSPVPPALMYFKNVARKIIPSFFGDSTALPINLNADSNYNFSFQTYSVPLEYDQSRLRAIVLLIDPSNGKVYNSNGKNVDAPTTPPVGINISDLILDFKIFPNPTYDNITISIENFTGNIQTEVYDLIGNRLQSTNETTISLQDYARGIYLLKVTYGDRVEEVKVIKD